MRPLDPKRGRALDPKFLMVATAEPPEPTRAGSLATELDISADVDDYIRVWLADRAAHRTTTKRRTPPQKGASHLDPKIRDGD